MATRITVKLAGPLGLDDAEQLRADLEKTTGLDWDRKSYSDRDHLSGLETIILTALITGAATEAGKMAARQATEQAKAAAKRLKDRYLSHPPDITVETSEADDDAAAGPGEALPAESGGAS